MRQIPPEIDARLNGALHPTSSGLSPALGTFSRCTPRTTLTLSPGSSGALCSAGSCETDPCLVQGNRRRKHCQLSREASKSFATRRRFSSDALVLFLSRGMPDTPSTARRRPTSWCLFSLQFGWGREVVASIPSRKNQIYAIVCLAYPICCDSGHRGSEVFTRRKP